MDFAYDHSKVAEAEAYLPENAPLMINQVDEPSRGYLMSPGDQTIIKVQDHVHHAPDRHCCDSTRSPHLRGLTINILLWAGIGYLILVMVTDLKNQEPLFISACVAAPLFALIYFIEAMCAGTCQYLWNFDAGEDVVSFVRRLRTYPPQVAFHCECYHYETHTTDSTDSQGNRTSSSHTERVTTYRETLPFLFNRSLDESGDISPDVLIYNTTRIDFTKALKFGDSNVADRYHGTKTSFIARNQHRDTHFDFSESCDIKDFQAKKLSIVDPERVSPCMNWGAYFFFTIFGMSAFYRYWMDRNSIQAKFTFIKTIFN